MMIDLADVSPADMYRLMTGVVVPRPIAFVSTVRPDGRFTLAPFSYFTAITNRPPLIGISMNSRKGTPKDTLVNIRNTGDFVVNVVTVALAERMVKTSGDWPADVDEFELTGLTPVASDRVRAPRVGESPVSLECTLHREIELGNATFVVGEVVRAHVDDAVIADGRVDAAKLAPLGRLGGDEYAPLGGIIHIARPRVTPPAESR